MKYRIMLVWICFFCCLCVGASGMKRKKKFGWCFPREEEVREPVSLECFPGKMSDDAYEGWQIFYYGKGAYAVKIFAGGDVAIRFLFKEEFVPVELMEAFKDISGIKSVNFSVCKVMHWPALLCLPKDIEAINLAGVQVYKPCEFWYRENEYPAPYRDEEVAQLTMYKKLKKLNISGSEITDECLKKLADYKKFLSLQDLTITNCSGITGKGLCDLAKVGLVSLAVGDCKEITNDDIKAFLCACIEKDTARSLESLEVVGHGMDEAMTNIIHKFKNLKKLSFKESAMGGSSSSVTSTSMENLAAMTGKDVQPGAFAKTLKPLKKSKSLEKICLPESVDQGLRLIASDEDFVNKSFHEDELGDVGNIREIADFLDQWEAVQDQAGWWRRVRQRKRKKHCTVQ